jgi:hypothetical protein
LDEGIRVGTGSPSKRRMLGVTFETEMGAGPSVEQPRIKRKINTEKAAEKDPPEKALRDFRLTPNRKRHKILVMATPRKPLKNSALMIIGLVILLIFGLYLGSMELPHFTAMGP